MTPYALTSSSYSDLMLRKLKPKKVVLLNSLLKQKKIKLKPPRKIYVKVKWLDQLWGYLFFMQVYNIGNSNSRLQIHNGRMKGGWLGVIRPLGMKKASTE